MKRKLFSLLLVLCLALPIGIGLVGCGGDTSGGGNSTPPQTTTQKSDAEILSSVYGKIVDSAYNATSSPTATSAEVLLAGEEDTIFVQSTDFSNVYSMYGIVKFMSKLYENEAVANLVSTPIKFNVTYKEKTRPLVIVSSLDKENNKVTGMVLADDESSSESLFLVFDVSYNFTTETVNNFTIYATNAYAKELLYVSQFDGQYLYWTGLIPQLKVDSLTEAQKAEVTNLQSLALTMRLAFDVKAEGKIDLNQDFGVEYTTAMEYMERLSGK